MTKTGEAARPPITSDPDSLLDTIQLYRNQISIGAIAVAVIVGGAFLWQASKARRESQAEKAFFDAMPAVSQNDPKGSDALAKIVARYSGTAGGAQAAMLYAQAKFDAGKYDDGQKVLDAVSGPAPFAAGIESLKAAGFEGQGQFGKAAEHYQAAVAKAQLDGEKDFLKGELARAYAAAGKKDEAVKLWTELAAKFDSPMAGEAKIRLGELSVVGAKK
jgi:predicted negative regulator of RcsB-dependent stress response